LIRHALVTHAKDVNVEIEVSSQSYTETCLASARRSVEQEPAPVWVASIRLKPLTLGCKVVSNVSDHGVFL
jgi:hypothetical protein